MTTIQQAFNTFAADSGHDYDPQALAIEAAQSFILGQTDPISGHEYAAVRDALNRVLAEDIIAPCDVPAHDNSAMDGYGVRHADLDPAADTKLPIRATVLAGPKHDGVLAPGTAIRIMTGAAIPAGVDTVIQQEKVECDKDMVIIPAGQRPGKNIRRAGEDLARGEIALRQGQRIGPAELGLLASLGLVEVKVVRRLRVAFFSTGDELTAAGSPLHAGKVYDSNRYTLFAMLTALNCLPIDMGIIADDSQALRAAFAQAAALADVIITSGGVSTGEADYVKTVISDIGEVLFWKIAMKPGRPFAFGRMGDLAAHCRWFFGLPGNPVAVMATFYQLVQPALHKLMGITPQPILPTFKVRLLDTIKKTPGRTEFQRGRLICENDTWCVRALPEQSSGILRSMSQADCFIVLPAIAQEIDAGMMVDVQVFDGIAG